MIRWVVMHNTVLMLVVHGDDIYIAGTKEITDSVVANLEMRFSAKFLGEKAVYMGSE